MPHYYVPPSSIAGNTFKITGDEAHHLADVVRVRKNDEISIFDGEGKSYLARIDTVTKEEISGVILSEVQQYNSTVKINIYLAVPKTDRFDWAVEKFAELGISSLTPLLTQRSVIKNISGPKMERYKRLSLAASKQCGRPDIMQVNEPIEFEKAIKNLPQGSLNLIPWEGEKKALKSDFSAFSIVNIFIGPEGGFSISEVEHARQSNVTPITLGPRILRVETAGLVCAVLVLNFFREFEIK